MTKNILLTGVGGQGIILAAKMLTIGLMDVRGMTVNSLQAVVVFPSFSIGTMLVVTVAGVLLFKERLQKLQWLALASIIAALFLLNI